MKKNRLYLVFTAVCIGFLLSGCAKAKEDRCDELYDDFINASTAFGTAPSEATCNDYKDAWHDYVSGCEAIPASVRAQYEDLLESMDCSIY